MEKLFFKSAWGWFPWAVIVFTVAVCILPMLWLGFDAGIFIMAIGFVLFEIGSFGGVYYKIEDDWLIVYSFFRPTRYPIAKIASVTPTKSVLAAPAVSLDKRLAIKFSDRSVLKSSMPLVVSPERAEAFIAALKAVNPAIEA